MMANPPDLSLNTLNNRTQVFSANTLAQNQLTYPNEYVVRFLTSVSRQHPSNMIQPATGLDIGFGSGQHLRLLMEQGFRTSGIELVSEAIDRAKQLYGNHPLMGELLQGDFRSANFLDAPFDAIICWGVLFLRPLSEMQTDLQQMYHLLKSGGQLCFNLRTKDNWFYGLGERLATDHFLLDTRAGAYANAHYTFLDEITTRQLIEDAGFELSNLERWDWWKNNMQERHSWWIVWVKRPD